MGFWGALGASWGGLGFREVPGRPPEAPGSGKPIWKVSLEVGFKRLRNSNLIDFCHSWVQVFASIFGLFFFPCHAASGEENIEHLLN